VRLSEDEIISIVTRELPDFHPTGPLQPLKGGNLNHVWRLNNKSKSLIIKVAPPYIVANPETPLSPDRIEFEANALQLFQRENPLYSLCSEAIRPPYIEFYDRENHLLVMEDLGELPHIGQFDLNQKLYPNLGKGLGHFIAQLHSKTHKSSELAKQFDNSVIQQTRLEVQYKPADDYAKRGGVEDTTTIHKRTEALGKQLLQPGCCLIMGDLWPPSILMDDNKIRLIDWEFAHFGRPLQDIGHFAAHCWMLAHTASSQKEGKSFKKLWGKFWQEYLEGLEPLHDGFFNDQEIKNAATHAGAEILVRTTGPFKNGYVYQSFEANHPLIYEAVAKAEQLIWESDLSSLWI
jgi:tRNA A-37 threonylcarbamoyl transferase component Bud32